MSTASTALIARVDRELERFLDDRTASLLGMGEDLAPLAVAARHAVLDGGKRLRPAFAYWGYRTVHDDVPDEVYVAAASLELLHASALVHDDVMDSSETRRGNPAAHTALGALHRGAGWVGDPAVFGASTAIIVGDLLLMWSDAMFASAGIAGEARRVFDDMRQLVMGGQYLDLLVQARAEFSAAEALRVVLYKTSKYTVEGPLHLGAAMAGAPPAVVTALSDYGVAVGEAFQLRDDVLGVFGDPAVTGKPAGDDLREGKQTLLTALAVESASESDAAMLRARLGDPALDSTGVDDLRDIIEKSGALDRVEQRIADQAGRAQLALQAAKISTDACEALTALAAAASVRAA